MVVACLRCGTKYEEDPNIRAGLCPRCWNYAREEYFAEKDEDYGVNDSLATEAEKDAKDRESFTELD